MKTVNKWLLALVLIISVTNKQYAQEVKEDGFVWVTELNYSSVLGFTEGLAPVYKNGLWGFINYWGEEVIQLAYSEVTPFHNGFSIVKHNGKYGVITKDGQQIFPFEYDKIGRFEDGKALATLNGKQVYLSKDGSTTALSKLFEYYDFSDGLARIRKNKKWGYINQKGRVVIEPQFTMAEDFSEGLALVGKKEGDKRFINKKGKTSDKAQVFPATSPQYNGGVVKYREHGRWGLATQNKVLMPARYDEIGEYSNRFYAIKLGKVWGFVSIDGTVISPRYSQVTGFKSGLSCVRTINKYGFINEAGDMVIGDVFDKATAMDNRYATVEIKGRKGIIKLKEYSDEISGIVASRPHVIDANSNGLIESNESFEISFSIKNVGSKTLENIRVSPILDYQIETMFSKVESFKIRKIHPGESQNVSVKLTTRKTIDNLQANIDLNIEADNLFNPEVVTSAIEMIGSKNASVEVVSYWFHNENYDDLKPGEKVTFQVTLQNVGKTIASEAKLKTAWPSFLLSDPQRTFSKKELIPGETAVFTTTFVIDPLCDKDQITVFCEINNDDQSPKYEYLKINIGDFNKMVDLTQESELQEVLASTSFAVDNRIVGETMQSPPKTTNDELLSLLDKTEQNMLKPNRFALIIGNENYSNQSVSYESDVDFAKRDAEAFAAYAKKIMGVPENNVILLKDATAARMKQNISKLIAVADNYGVNAELIVFYAGHGQHDSKTKETYLIPVDVSLTSPRDGVQLAYLYEQLGNSRAGKVNVFLDACYSGVGRGIIVEVNESKIPGNVLVMTATSSTQKSMPYKEKRHGLFTYYLLKTLGDTKGDITMAELYNNVEEQVKHNSIWLNNSEQTPGIIEGSRLSPDWKDWRFNK